jgi:hypothetical protein
VLAADPGQAWSLAAEESVLGAEQPALRIAGRFDRRGLSLRNTATLLHCTLLMTKGLLSLDPQGGTETPATVQIAADDSAFFNLARGGEPLVDIQPTTAGRSLMSPEDLVSWTGAWNAIVGFAAPMRLPDRSATMAGGTPKSRMLKFPEWVDARLLQKDRYFFSEGAPDFLAGTWERTPAAAELTAAVPGLALQFGARKAGASL